MSTTATAVQQTPVTTQSTIKMNSSFHPQGHPPSQPQQQAAPYQLQPGQQQQSFQPGTPSGPFPNPASFQHLPQQPFNPQQQQQFAQWAYQQMLYQQQQLAFQPHGPNPQSPYMTPQQQQALQMQFMQQQQQLMMQQQQQHAAAQQQQQFPRPPQPPYARENNSSKTSLNSNNGDGSGRRRTTSNKSAPGRSRTGSTGASQASVNGKGSSAQPPTHRHRVPSTSSHRSASSSTALPNRDRPNMSSAASTISSTSSASTAPASNNASGTSKTQRQPAKPSPLSQGSHPSPSKPSYRDVASSAVKPAANGPRDPAPTPEMLKSGGLTGRLRRALSFSALDEAGHEDAKSGSRRKAVNAKLASEGQIPQSPSAQTPRPSTDSAMTLGQNNQPSSSSSSVPQPVAYVPTEGSIRSTDTATAPKKSRSLFNAKFNRSTDNMSLSSTVSSASMMIRKLGSVGKLVRRNSLMGISSVFKGKKDKDKERAESDGEAPPEAGDKKKSKFKNPLKSRKAEASVSHATAELEAGSSGDVGGDDMAGLSPAAKLVRQHTLRTRAADEARAKADQRGPHSEDANQKQTPSTWEKNTTTRGGNQSRKPVNEVGGGWNGEDDDFSEDGSTFDGHRHQPPAQDWRDPADFEDSDEEQGYGDGYDEEDETVRLEGQYDEGDPADEPWAVGLRRSVERTRVPAKGILKNADSYNQNQFLDGPPQAPFTRARSNSNDSAPPMGAEPGPLARIPSPDPDHIDGLHRSNSDHHSHHSRKLSTSSNNSAGGSAFLPALNFGDESDSTSLAASLSAFGAAGGKERPLSGHSGNFPYSNADFNASAPALASISATSNAKQPAMAHRSATVPLTKSSKKLTFAANLSVYHTFSPGAYDRRSEPATCNRLTPTLAQRIKEELNSYKMEEMEVHQASRMHTHFFV